MTGDRSDDSGFTLVEVIVVVTLIALVTTVIAGTLVVVMRTTPSTEARADDSRSLLGLTNQLSHDVMSAAEDGFEFGASTRCLSSSVPASSGVVQLRWSESGTTYVSDYRYVETKPGYGKLQRFACRQGEAAARSTLTSELKNDSGGNPPLTVTPRPTTLADGTSGYKGVQLSVFVYDDDGSQRELLNLDATTENVVTTLPVAPSAPTGTPLPPIALDTPSPITVPSAAFGFAFDLPAFDPNGDDLSGSLVGPAPPGFDIAFIGPTALIDVSAPAGTTASFTYRVSDPFGATDDGVISLSVISAVTAGTFEPPLLNSAVAYAVAGQPVTFTLPATDPELATSPAGVPDTAVFAPGGLPVGWTASTTGVDVTVTPATGASGYYRFEYTVTDADTAATSSSMVTVALCEASIVSVSPSTVQVQPDGDLVAGFDVSINKNDSCGPLVAQFEPFEGQVPQAAKPFNSGTVLSVAPSEFLWSVPPVSGQRVIPIELRLGIGGTVLDTRNLTTEPEAAP